MKWLTYLLCIGGAIVLLSVVFAYVINAVAPMTYVYQWAHKLGIYSNEAVLSFYAEIVTGGSFLLSVLVVAFGCYRYFRRK